MTELILSAITSVRAGNELTQPLLDHYLKRIARLQPCRSVLFATEEQMWAGIDRQSGRTEVRSILFDAGGRLATSEEFAGVLRQWRDGGTQRIMLGVGPANGWSETSRTRATALFSLGRMTLPHELARVVVAEQTYRALTILAGHPYHCGH